MVEIRFVSQYENTKLPEASGHREQHAFGEQLPHQPEAVRSHSDANRDLFAPLAVARQQKIRQVRACQREDQPHQNRQKRVSGRFLGGRHGHHAAGRKQAHLAVLALVLGNRIFVVDVTPHCVQRRFRGRRRDARRQPLHHAKQREIRAVENPAAQFRCNGGSRRYGKEQVRGGHRKDTEKVLGSDADHRDILPIQAQSLAHYLWIGVQAAAPQPVADHGHRRSPLFFRLCSEKAPASRFHAHRREIFRRDQVAENPGRLRSRRCVECEAEWNRSDKRRGRSAHTPLVPVALEIRI